MGTRTKESKEIMGHVAKVETLDRDSMPPSKDMVSKFIGTINIGGVIFSVYLTDWKSTPNEYGSIVTPSNRIYLNRHANPQQMLTALVHEMLHYMFEEYQIRKLLDGQVRDMEENIIEALDKPITTDILMNPDNFKMFRRILSGEFYEDDV